MKNNNSIIPVGTNKLQNNVTNNNSELENTNPESSFLRNNYSQNSISNNNNFDLLLEDINNPVGSESSFVIRGKKRALSQASDSSHVNVKQKSLNAESNNIQEESSNQNNIIDQQQLEFSNLNNILPITDQQREWIASVERDSYTMIDEIGWKQKQLAKAVYPLPEDKYSGIWIRIREVLDTIFSEETIAHDDTFERTLTTNLETNEQEWKNVLRSPETINNPTRISLKDIEFNIIQSVEDEENLDYDSDSFLDEEDLGSDSVRDEEGLESDSVGDEEDLESNSVEDSRVNESHDIVNANISVNNGYDIVNTNSADIMRADNPETFVRHPEHPEDHNLTVDSTDDSRSGIDPESSNDYPSDISQVLSTETPKDLPGMVDLFSELPLTRIGYTWEARWDRFEYSNYVVEMKGRDDLNYRTVYVDLIEYLDTLDNLKSCKEQLLAFKDYLDPSYFTSVGNSIFNALLYIAQFN